MQGWCFGNHKFELAWLRPFVSLASEVKIWNWVLDFHDAGETVGAQPSCLCTGWHSLHAHCTFWRIAAFEWSASFQVGLGNNTSEYCVDSSQRCLLLTCCFYGNLEVSIEIITLLCLLLQRTESKGELKKWKQVTWEKLFSYFDNDVPRWNVFYDSPHSKIQRKWEGLKHTQMMWFNELIKCASFVLVPL